MMYTGFRNKMYVWAHSLWMLGRHLAFDACFKLCCFKRIGQQADMKSLNQEHFIDDADIEAVSQTSHFIKGRREKDDTCAHDIKADESGDRSKENTYRQVIEYLVYMHI